MNSANERISKLRKAMEDSNIDIYIIPTSDYHMSEYVSDYFKCREYFSGFTGSAGTLVVDRVNSYLFADGRYHIQAAEEIKNTEIKLMKVGDKGVPKLEELVSDLAKNGGKIGFDGAVVSYSFGCSMEKIAANNDGLVVYEEDLAGKIWKERPEIVFNDIYTLEEKYAGKSVDEKLEMVRDKMKKEGAHTFVLSSLDDLAWLFNLRGKDIPRNPVFLSFGVITLDEATIYTGEEIPQELQSKRINRKSYFEIYKDLENITGKVMIDTCVVNYKLVKSLKKAKVIDRKNVTIEMKAIKNSVEIKNLKECHLKDGVAVTKFIYWLKNNIGKRHITEIDASNYLEQMRRQAGCVDLSFDTISAYGANAAMMHYSASEENSAVLKLEGMLLVDSGGQYLQGTTDVTRTIVLGPIDDEIKMHYTLVVKAMLNLANARFLYGCTGYNLDILARGPLWDIDMDYKCGTGHGVGYMLNVHEGPNGFRWKKVPEREDGCVLEEGMVTTDEPGVYVEGSHGIRIENELVCVKGDENEYGQFMKFETLTFVPIDLEGIDKRWLNETDIKRINDYHEKVYSSLSEYLDADERTWLRESTKSI